MMTGYKEGVLNPKKNIKCVFNQYKNSIGIIKSILKFNQIIGGQSDEQPRIGDCILVNFINLS